MSIRFNCLIIHLFLIACSTAHAKTIDSCHPQVKTTSPQYIVAYGSLMQTKSKTATDSSSGNNLPVLVDHYQRGWLAKGVSLGLSTTYLAAIKKPNAHFNGTIFRLATAGSIKNYDAREKYYCRVAVPATFIHRLDQKALPQAEFWIYEVKPEFIAKPSKHYPLVESYIDIFLSGCLEIEKKFHLKNFAATCIETTSDWSTNWVNDRIYPRRPFVFQPDAPQIDQLLADKIPKIFKQIKFELNTL